MSKGGRINRHWPCVVNYGGWMHQTSILIWAVEFRYTKSHSIKLSCPQVVPPSLHRHQWRRPAPSRFPSLLLIPILDSKFIIAPISPLLPCFLFLHGHDLFSTIGFPLLKRGPLHYVRDATFLPTRRSPPNRPALAPWSFSSRPVLIVSFILLHLIKYIFLQDFYFYCQCVVILCLDE